MDTHCVFRAKRDDIGAFIGRNKGLVVVYGASYWGAMLAGIQGIKADYFCDRNAAWMHALNGISVIDIDTLHAKIEEDGKRATIIICVENKGTVISIVKDLMQADVNADVFDYFENEVVFCDTKFSLQGKEYLLFEHSYNCGYTSTRMTERSVEMALAREYVNACNSEIVEIGAVTPYYFYDEKIREIMDPTDTHRRVIKKSIFDCDLNKKHVLSISTVEHIGTSDYGMHESENAISAIEKIVRESATCLITAPLGYNKLLDGWVKENDKNEMVKILKRNLNNHWEEITGSYEEVPYTRLWANGLVVIKKV